MKAQPQSPGGCKAAWFPMLPLLAAATLASAQNTDLMLTASAGMASANGGEGNVTTGENTAGENTMAEGFVTVAVDGRSKTIGSMSASGASSNTTNLDVIEALEPPIQNAVSPNLTTGIPVPPLVSVPAGPPQAGSPVESGEEGAVRLVSRVDVNGFATGALQVFLDGAWGAVCTSKFDDRDALVACRQLGFTNGGRTPQDPTFRQLRPDPDLVAPFALENLGCSGEETRLVDCPAMQGDDVYSSGGYRFMDYNEAVCDPYRGTFAKIACSSDQDVEEGSVRLANGAAAADMSAEFGRLEVFHSGGWGTVCDNDFVSQFNRPDRPKFTAGAANVACMQLGYKRGEQIQKLEDDDADSTSRVPIFLAGLDCEGSEQNIGACPDFQLGQVGSVCSHRADVHLVCYNDPNPDVDGTTRLVDGSAGPGYEYGRLEIFDRGFWSNVCNNGRFTPDSAQVACKAVGYDGGAALRFTQSFASSLSQVLFENLPVALAAVDCDGNETSIAECQNNEEFISTCSNITSSTVLACAHSSGECGIMDGTTEGSLRLRGGFGTPCDPVHSGFIEILHFEEWGSICTSQFSEDFAEDNLVADVACRQLGFPHGTRVDPLTALPPLFQEDGDDKYSYEYITPEEAEEPVEQFWLSGVQCSGPETQIVGCDLGQGFIDNNFGCSSRPHRIHVACRQFAVVEALEAVTTPGAEEGDLRLIDEAPVANWITGRLQVFFEGSWSQVCAGDFQAPDANVACRQLGYGAGTVVPQFLSDADEVILRTTAVFPEVGISASGCTGSEEHLLDCEMAQDLDLMLNRDCLNSDGFGLVLGCVDTPGEGEEGAVRLTNTEQLTPDSQSGILEIFHAGAWGTICIGEFGFLRATAQVACRGMGFATGIFQDAVPSTLFLPPWLSGIRCAGNEPAVGACRRSEYGEASTCGDAQRLICSSLPADQGRGDVRLAGGKADPGGSWEYGRLEVQIGGIWSIIEERGGQIDLGRGGAQVACRSLGYATGAQLLVGSGSPFPVDVSTPELIRDIICDGTEDSFADCRITTDYYQYIEFAFGDLATNAVALICTSPSGCETATPAPSEGDVRLMTLNGTAAGTAACDEVHFGGVEMFFQGRWGRICNGRLGSDHDEFTLDAQVICRQLGFRFGTVMNEADFPGAYEYNERAREDENVLTWASEVVCTGKEERLLDCFFPENFGIDYVNTPPTDYNDYASIVQAPSSAVRAQVQTGTAPPPSNGLEREECSSGDMRRLSVICRRFDIRESAFIRR